MMVYVLVNFLDAEILVLKGDHELLLLNLLILVMAWLWNSPGCTRFLCNLDPAYPEKLLEHTGHTLEGSVEDGTSCGSAAGLVVGPLSSS